MIELVIAVTMSVLSLAAMLLYRDMLYLRKSRLESENTTRIALEAFAHIKAKNLAEVVQTEAARDTFKSMVPPVPDGKPVPPQDAGFMKTLLRDGVATDDKGDTFDMV
jgi:hypothetical protein